MAGKTNWILLGALGIGAYFLFGRKKNGMEASQPQEPMGQQAVDEEGQIVNLPPQTMQQGFTPTGEQQQVPGAFANPTSMEDAPREGYFDNQPGQGY